MGVDQVVEVEMVGADGSLIVANGDISTQFKRQMASRFDLKIGNQIKWLAKEMEQV